MNALEIELKMLFHEAQMNKKDLPRYWRDKSEQMYWHYLDILTKPDREVKNKL